MGQAGLSVRKLERRAAKEGASDEKIDQADVSPATVSAESSHQTASNILPQLSTVRGLLMRTVAANRTPPTRRSFSSIWSSREAGIRGRWVRRRRAAGAICRPRGVNWRGQQLRESAEGPLCSRQINSNLSTAFPSRNRTYSAADAAIPRIESGYALSRPAGSLPPRARPPPPAHRPPRPRAPRSSGGNTPSSRAATLGAFPAAGPPPPAQHTSSRIKSSQLRSN